MIARAFSLLTLFPPGSLLILPRPLAVVAAAPALGVPELTASRTAAGSKSGLKLAKLLLLFRPAGPKEGEPGVGIAECMRVVLVRNVRRAGVEWRRHCSSEPCVRESLAAYSTRAPTRPLCEVWES